MSKASKLRPVLAESGSGSRRKRRTSLSEKQRKEKVTLKLTLTLGQLHQLFGTCIVVLNRLEDANSSDANSSTSSTPTGSEPELIVPKVERDETPDSEELETSDYYAPPPPPPLTDLHASPAVSNVSIPPLVPEFQNNRSEEKQLAALGSPPQKGRRHPFCTIS